MAYTDTHSTDILAIETHTETLCMDCACENLFLGNEELLEDVNSGKDMSLEAPNGASYTILHTDSINRFEGSAEEWYATGLYCTYCGGEIIQPLDI